MKKNFINDFTYIFYCRKAKMIFIMAIGTTFFFIQTCLWMVQFPPSFSLRILAVIPSLGILIHCVLSTGL